MKTTILLTTAALILSFGLGLAPLNAQAPGDGLSEEQRDRIESMRVAHLTKKIELTSEQAKQFWPLYNEMQEELRESRKDRVSDEKDPMEMTEEEAEEQLAIWMNELENEMAIRKRYLSRFGEVLDSRQVLALYRAENEFRRHMLRQVRNNRERIQMHRSRERADQMERRRGHQQRGEERGDGLRERDREREHRN